jgi:hypothetical protein
MAAQGRAGVNYPADPTSCFPAGPPDPNPVDGTGESNSPGTDRDGEGTDRGTALASVTDAAADLAALLGRCRTVLRRINEETASAVWGFDWATDEQDPLADLDRGVDLVVGRRNIERKRAWLRDLPGRHLITTHAEPVPQDWSLRSKVSATDHRLLDRGVSVQEIYPRESGLSAQQHLFLLQRHLTGISLRLMPTVPADLMIIDRAVAVLPVDPDRPDWALAVVTNQMWVQAARQVTDACWNSATGYATDPPATVPEHVASGVRTGTAGAHRSACALVE